MIRRYGAFKIIRALKLDRMPIPVDRYNFQFRRREAISRRAGGQEQSRARVFQDEAQPLGRMRRIQRYVGSSCFQHGQHRCDHFNAARQTDRNARFGVHSE